MPPSRGFHHSSTIFVRQIASMFVSKFASCHGYHFLTPFATIRGAPMGSPQKARRVTRDRARRHPLIRPDYLRLYKVKVGPDAPHVAGLPATIPVADEPEPGRSRARRAFLIALIAATGVNFGAILGLVSWGVLQAFGVFGEPAIETVQREQGASIAQLDATVQALNASVTG